MKAIRWFMDGLKDLWKGPGTLKERVERQEKLLLFLVLVLGAILRLLLLAKFHGELYTRREKGFWFPAWNWVNGHGLGISRDCPTSYRTPLYIFFVIPFFAVFGLNYTWPLGLAQVAVAVASVYLTFRVGKEWRSARAGLLGALFMAVYPYDLYHDIQFYPTFLFTFFLLLTVLGFLRTERTRSWKEGALTGVWLGLAMLSQSGPLVFFAPLASVWLWRRWGSFKQAAKIVAVIAGMALFTMSPWIIRNYQVHHVFMLLTDDGGRVFYKAYNPWAFYMLTHDIHVDYTPDPPGGYGTPMTGLGKTGCGFLGMTEVESDHFWYGKAWEWIKANPWGVPPLIAYKFVQLWAPRLWTPKEAFGDNSSKLIPANLEDWAYAFSFGFLLTFGLFECAVETKEERKRTWFFVLLAIAFSITYSITYAFSKYRIPFDSVLAVMSAAGLWRWIEAIEARRKK